VPAGAELLRSRLRQQRSKWGGDAFPALSQPLGRVKSPASQASAAPALKGQRALPAGVEAAGVGEAAAAGFSPAGDEVTPAQLRSWLSFPEE
jgi:hypothetical protein